MVNQKIRKYVKLAIYIGLILTSLWFVYKIYFHKDPISNSGIELFNNMNNSYGNIISYSTGNKPNNEYKEATRQIIRLPGRFKLTGFKISGVVLTQITVGTQNIWVFTTSPDTLFTGIISSDIHTITQDGKTYYALKTRSMLEKIYPGDATNIVELKDTTNAGSVYYALTKYTVPAFRVAMVNNEVDINNPANYVNVDINNNPDLKLNTDYKEFGMFDNIDKTAKYAGSIFIISQSFADSLVTRPIYITGWELYGLAPYAPCFNDYSVMEKLNSDTLPLSTTSKQLNLSTNKKIYYLELVNNTNNTHSDYNIRVQYKNTLDNLTNVYSINGPVQLAFSNASQYIYLDEPVIASMLIITNSISGTSTGVNIYGTNASITDENLFKLEQGKYDPKGIIIEGKKCPNVGEMMQKQLQSQQICEALEQKDRIRNKKASYERDKAYLKKLAEQDSEIKQLADKITGLIERKNARIRESSISGDAQKLDAELEKIQALRREAEEYIRKPGSAELNVNVNLEPDLDLDYIKKNITQTS